MEQTISSTSKSPFATEPIGRLIVKFAVPCVISLLVNSLYNIVDQIFIGWGVGYLGNGANLTRVLRRGLEAAEDHCLLSATALNLKRMIRCMG